MIAVDTSVLIELEAGNARIIEKLKELRNDHPENPSIPFICLSEFYYGLLKSGESMEAGLEFLGKFTPLHSTYRSAKLIAELKLGLERKGSIIKLFDIIIAALAMDHNATLITMDRDFERIEGLKMVFVQA